MWEKDFCIRINANSDHPLFNSLSLPEMSPKLTHNFVSRPWYWFWLPYGLHQLVRLLVHLCDVGVLWLNTWKARVGFCLWWLPHDLFVPDGGSDPPTLKETSSGNALIQHLSEKNAIFMSPVLPGSAEAHVIWGGTVKCFLIAYFMGNISAKKYQNVFTDLKVIAKQRWDVFWDTVYLDLFINEQNVEWHKYSKTVLQILSFMKTEHTATKNVGQCPTWWPPCQI